MPHEGDPAIGGGDDDRDAGRGAQRLAAVGSGTEVDREGRARAADGAESIDGGNRLLELLGRGYRDRDAVAGHQYVLEARGSRGPGRHDLGELRGVPVRVGSRRTDDLTGRSRCQQVHRERAGRVDRRRAEIACALAIAGRIGRQARIEVEGERAGVVAAQGAADGRHGAALRRLDEGIMLEIIRAAPGPSEINWPLAPSGPGLG